MDIEAFSRQENMLKLREHLVAVEEERLSGKKGYSIEDTVSLMQVGAMANEFGNERTDCRCSS
jgi:hypothetical protein